jgi:hypothetical protein
MLDSSHSALRQRNDYFQDNGEFFLGHAPITYSLNESPLVYLGAFPSLKHPKPLDETVITALAGVHMT